MAVERFDAREQLAVVAAVDQHLLSGSLLSASRCCCDLLLPLLPRLLGWGGAQVPAPFPAPPPPPPPPRPPDPQRPSQCKQQDKPALGAEPAAAPAWVPRAATRAPRPRGSKARRTHRPLWGRTSVHRRDFSSSRCCAWKSAIPGGPGLSQCMLRATPLANFFPDGLRYGRAICPPASRMQPPPTTTLHYYMLLSTHQSMEPPPALPQAHSSLAPRHSLRLTNSLVPAFPTIRVRPPENLEGGVQPGSSSSLSRTGRRGVRRRSPPWAAPSRPPSSSVLELSHSVD